MRGERGDPPCRSDRENGLMQIGLRCACTYPDRFSSQCRQGRKRAGSAVGWARTASGEDGGGVVVDGWSACLFSGCGVTLAAVVLARGAVTAWASVRHKIGICDNSVCSRPSGHCADPL